MGGGAAENHSGGVLWYENVGTYKTTQRKSIIKGGNDETSRLHLKRGS